MSQGMKNQAVSIDEDVEVNENGTVSKNGYFNLPREIIAFLIFALIPAFGAYINNFVVYLGGTLVYFLYACDAKAKWEGRYE